MPLLIEAAMAEPLVDLRFRNRVTNVDARSSGAFVDIETPDGEYALFDHVYFARNEADFRWLPPGPTPEDRRMYG